MNIRKIVVYVVSFICFVITGLMISNIQSMQADQILNANGLSGNSRMLVTNRNIEIATLLKHLQKYQGNDELELQLTNKYDPDQVLVWSNTNKTKLPVTKGRYFIPSDFMGQVTFALASPDSSVRTLTTQNNEYVILNNRYISVLGRLKQNVSQTQNTYYLTTGVNQFNSKNRLSNYYIILDSPTRGAIDHTAKYLKAEVGVPAFVKKHQQTHRTLAIGELSLIVLAIIVAILSSIVLAIMQTKKADLVKVKGALFRNLLVNKTWRFMLVEIAISIFTYWLLSVRAYFTDQSIYGYVLIMTVLMQMIAYSVVFILENKKAVN